MRTPAACHFRRGEERRRVKGSAETDHHVFGSLLAARDLSSSLLPSEEEEVGKEDTIPKEKRIAGRKFERMRPDVSRYEVSAVSSRASSSKSSLTDDEIEKEAPRIHGPPRPSPSSRNEKKKKKPRRPAPSPPLTLSVVRPENERTALLRYRRIEREKQLFYESEEIQRKEKLLLATKAKVYSSRLRVISRAAHLSAQESRQVRMKKQDREISSERSCSISSHDQDDIDHDTSSRETHETKDILIAEPYFVGPILEELITGVWTPVRCEIADAPAPCPKLLRVFDARNSAPGEVSAIESSTFIQAYQDGSFSIGHRHFRPQSSKERDHWLYAFIDAGATPLTVTSSASQYNNSIHTLLFGKLAASPRDTQAPKTTPTNALNQDESSGSLGDCFLDTDLSKSANRQRAQQQQQQQQLKHTDNSAASLEAEYKRMADDLEQRRADQARLELELSRQAEQQRADLALREKIDLQRHAEKEDERVRLLKKDRAELAAQEHAELEHKRKTEEERAKELAAKEVDESQKESQLKGRRRAAQQRAELVAQEKAERERAELERMQQLEQERAELAAKERADEVLRLQLAEEERTALAVKEEQLRLEREREAERMRAEVAAKERADEVLRLQREEEERTALAAKEEQLRLEREREAERMRAEVAAKERADEVLRLQCAEEERTALAVKEDELRLEREREAERMRAEIAAKERADEVLRLQREAEERTALAVKEDAVPERKKETKNQRANVNARNEVDQEQAEEVGIKTQERTVLDFKGKADLQENEIAVPARPGAKQANLERLEEAEREWSDIALKEQAELRRRKTAEKEIADILKSDLEQCKRADETKPELAVKKEIGPESFASSMKDKNRSSLAVPNKNDLNEITRSISCREHNKTHDMLLAKKRQESSRQLEIIQAEREARLNAQVNRLALKKAAEKKQARLAVLQLRNTNDHVADAIIKNDAKAGTLQSSTIVDASSKNEEMPHLFEWYRAFHEEDEGSSDDDTTELVARPKSYLEAHDPSTVEDGVRSSVSASKLIEEIFFDEDENESTSSDDESLEEVGISCAAKPCPHTTYTHRGAFSLESKRWYCAIEWERYALEQPEDWRRDYGQETKPFSKMAPDYDDASRSVDDDEDF